MNRMLRVIALAAPALLAGCMGYYPDTGYGAPNGSYPNGGYPNGSYGGYPPSGGYGYPSNGGYATGATLRCESDNGQTRHCDADTRGGVRLDKQLSRTDCIQGRNWGYDNGGIWVSGGCRGQFTTGSGGTYGSGYGNVGTQAIRCESDNGSERHCSVAVRSNVQLSKQLSNTRCVQGQNWRWDRDGIWVKDGCRGEFQVY